jgi:hypothetical protein
MLLGMLLQGVAAMWCGFRRLLLQRHLTMLLLLLLLLLLLSFYPRACRPGLKCGCCCWQPLHALPSPCYCRPIQHSCLQALSRLEWL